MAVASTLPRATPNIRVSIDILLLLSHQQDQIASSSYENALSCWCPPSPLALPPLTIRPCPSPPRPPPPPFPPPPLLPFIHILILGVHPSSASSLSESSSSPELPSSEPCDSSESPEPPLCCEVSVRAMGVGTRRDYSACCGGSSSPTLPPSLTL